MQFTDLSTLNAILNGISAIFLFQGFRFIKKGEKETHKKYMISALITSGLFLVSYLIYHYNVGSVPYPYDDWTRTVYLIILVPHIILAGIMGPFILVLVVFAFKAKFEQHKKLARWVWPVWMYVSVTGVVIYLMLYIF